MLLSMKTDLYCIPHAGGGDPWVEDRFGDDVPEWAEERWGDDD